MATTNRSRGVTRLSLRRRVTLVLLVVNAVSLGLLIVFNRFEARDLAESFDANTRAIEERTARVRTYFDPLLKKSPSVRPVGLGMFAGALDYSTLSRSLKPMAEAMGFVEGDFREWDKIKSWAGEVAPKLLKA